MEIEFSPYKNPEVISIILQADGNWKGYKQVNGKVAEVREIKPEDALYKLLTHE